MAAEHRYGVARDDVKRLKMFGLIADRTRRYRGPVPLDTLTTLVDEAVDAEVAITDGRGGLMDQYRYDTATAQRYIEERIRGPVEDDADIGVMLEAKENDGAARMVAHVTLPDYASTFPGDDFQIFLDVPYTEEGTLEAVIDRYDVPHRDDAVTRSSP